MNVLTRKNFIDELPPPENLKSDILLDILDRISLTVIDAGARRNFFSDLRPISQSVQGVGFEPDAEECETLNSSSPDPWSSLEFIPRALSDSVGEETLHLCQDEGKSSFLKPDFEYLRQFGRTESYEIKEELTVPVTTLDTLAEDRGFRAPVFVKLDVQGLEDRVLRGGESLLRDRGIGIKVEVPFRRAYRDQPSFQEVNAILNEYGFELVDLVRESSWPYRRENTGDLPFDRGVLVEGDALYVRNPERMVSGTTFSNQDFLALMMVLVCYSCFSQARGVAAGLCERESTETGISQQELLSALERDSTHFKRHYRRAFVRKLFNKLNPFS